MRTHPYSAAKVGQEHPYLKGPIVCVPTHLIASLLKHNNTTLLHGCIPYSLLHEGVQRCMGSGCLDVLLSDVNPMRGSPQPGHALCQYAPSTANIQQVQACERLSGMGLQALHCTHCVPDKLAASRVEAMQRCKWAPGAPPAAGKSSKLLGFLGVYAAARRLGSSRPSGVSPPGLAWPASRQSLGVT